MKILFLGYNKKETSLIGFLRANGHDVYSQKSQCKCFKNYDLVISYGYRFIISKSEISSSKRPIINLHISYLPFNRGAHPNFWAHYEGTPSGITIHEIDLGIDTGKIIAQKEIRLCKNETLQSSQKILLNEIEKLFIKNFKMIENYTYKTFSPSDGGSFHQKKDLPEWVRWDMKLNEITKK